MTNKVPGKWLIDMIPVAAFVVIMVVGLQTSGWQAPAELMIVNAIMVVGSYIFIGNSGIVSFGHMGFAAIGAYTSALLTMSPMVKGGLIDDSPTWLVEMNVAPVVGVVAGGLLAAVFGLLVSFAIVRLSGLSAGIATLAILVVVQVVIGNADSITGGKNSLVGIPDSGSSYTLLGWFIAIAVIAYVFQNTRMGRRLRATREDEVAAKSIGIGMSSERRWAFVVSAFAVGIGGALYGQILGSINAEAFFLTLTFFTLLMLVFGGMGSLFGAIAGTFAITLLAELLRRWESGIDMFGMVFAGRAGTRELGLGIVMLIVLFTMRSGITRGRELSGFWRRRQQKAGKSGGIGRSADADKSGDTGAVIPADKTTA